MVTVLDISKAVQGFALLDYETLHETGQFLRMLSLH